ncbi:M23 family metallopeptidase [Moraxella sp. Pampa]|uniref:M23 family metallopeptidase n=1 Tax=Moraxella sp. Pampa TaxID=3111978 RepID=UPI002B413F9E|nr:M23 family metallopeptidase [Moraxella sp. Pampa]
MLMDVLFKPKNVLQVMTVGVFGMAVLTGCASKPTYQQNKKSTTLNVANISTDPKIVMDSRGVPSHHLVRQGDTVSKIAERYGLDWRTIGRINNLNAQYTIYTGQWLVLWQGNESVSIKTSITPVQQTVAPPNQTLTTTKTVLTKPADTPQVVANKPLSVGSVGLMQFRYPVSSSNPVVRRFGTTNINGKAVTSQGMWFSGRAGDAVLASRTGTVLHADGNIDGAMIAIAHTDGFVSNYFHIYNAQVKSGQTVQAGQQIATMRPQADGMALLEFRISRNSSYIDPLSVLK